MAKMTPASFDWVDAFSDAPFMGNGCAVVYDGGKWSDEQCLAYVRETGLVECTFIAKSSKADAKVRYFLASHEIPFAGHPTIATATSLLDRGLINEEATFETGAGILPISIKDGLVTMQQNAPRFGDEYARDEIAKIFGLTAHDIIDTPQFVSTGLPFVVTLLKNRSALERAKLNEEELTKWRNQYNIGAFCEPYLATLDAIDGDSLGRLLLPAPNPAEDPFTGSASGCLASYLWSRGHIKTSKFIHEQGHMLDRKGQATIECVGSFDNIEAVLVSGKGCIVMRGEVLA